jgi:hypothetical protein
MILPGIKNVFRFFDDEGMYYADGVVLDSEKEIDTIYHPHHSDKHSSVANRKSEVVLKKSWKTGKNFMICHRLRKRPCMLKKVLPNFTLNTNASNSRIFTKLVLAVN